ncbi:unnamed protein product [Strongylus vulgaris]|uniref:Uncharacterized protein n=1 Tax=Strongylus vulgaris TaxID=40348 RepID=A0A3P7K742_STRVU|nr:unnamed protein product [Strongylus vulgaris]
MDSMDHVNVQSKPIRFTVTHLDDEDTQPISDPLTEKQRLPENLDEAQIPPNRSNRSSLNYLEDLNSRQDFESPSTNSRPHHHDDGMSLLEIVSNLELVSDDAQLPRRMSKLSHVLTFCFG